MAAKVIEGVVLRRVELVFSRGLFVQYSVYFMRSG